MGSLSVRQKRRFEATGTHLERHGIDDGAGDGKRITGEDAGKSSRAQGLANASVATSDKNR